MDLDFICDDCLDIDRDGVCDNTDNCPDTANPDQIDADELSFILMPIGQARPTVPSDLFLTEATDRFQSDYIEQAISRTRGNMSVAAKQLGLHRSNLYRKMRQLGMAVNE